MFFVAIFRTFTRKSTNLRFTFIQNVKKVKNQPTLLYKGGGVHPNWFDGRVSSKRSKFFFGSNRNKPKLNLFRLFFGLFRETKKKIFRFVSVCFGVSDRYRNNRNKQNFFETNRNKPKKSQKTHSLKR
jgi:hypothetical protein